jgi:hypothetical protein
VVLEELEPRHANTTYAYGTEPTCEGLVEEDTRLITTVLRRRHIAVGDLPSNGQAGPPLHTTSSTPLAPQRIVPPPQQVWFVKYPFPFGHYHINNFRTHNKIILINDDSIIITRSPKKCYRKIPRHLTT